MPSPAFTTSSRQITPTPLILTPAIYGPPNGNTGAIPAALRTLDPHSNFFDPRAFALLREDQEGKYYGVGMSIQARPGKMGKLVTVVVAPIPGSPAFRAGLRPGDIVAKVDGKPTDGLEHLPGGRNAKGPQGHAGSRYHPA